jgi:hypothetical protein
MNHFLDILMNVRIAVMEVCGTLGTIFIMAYGAFKAFGDFVVPLFKKVPQRTARPTSTRQARR